MRNADMFARTARHWTTVYAKGKINSIFSLYWVSKAIPESLFVVVAVGAFIHYSVGEVGDTRRSNCDM